MCSFYQTFLNVYGLQNKPLKVQCTFNTWQLNIFKCLERLYPTTNSSDRVFVPKNEGEKCQQYRSEILVVIAWSNTNNICSISQSKRVLLTLLAHLIITSGARVQQDKRLRYKMITDAMRAVCLEISHLFTGVNFIIILQVWTQSSWTKVYSWIFKLKQTLSLVYISLNNTESYDCVLMWY